MFYHVLNDKLLLSEHPLNYYPNLDNLNIKKVSKESSFNFKDNIYALNKLNPLKTRRSFTVNSVNSLFLKEETIDLLKKPLSTSVENTWLFEKINNRKITFVNTEYKSFKDIVLNPPNFPLSKEKININVVGLGDVGGTLITGLRLLGRECIDTIGIYDTDTNKVKRWNLECNQISSISKDVDFPEIIPKSEEELFDCDLFVFCVSIGVPKVGEEKGDLRISQFKGNSKIIDYYANLARENNFKGIFSVVSDPVDLLCKRAFEYSNKNKEGKWDFKGMAPEQIRGYGLGVMHGRALYYSKDIAPEYKIEGRAFGPHGKGLIIANSINNYNDSLSLLLTEKTKNANIEVRKTGFKPYIAPSLSSGAISLIDTIKGNWNYSANFLGGTYLGCKNKISPSGLELETLDFHKKLFERLTSTYELIDNIYNSI
ncbi:lactate/malate family dehydrogenase [Haloimpatiens sp. FM7315]|uniref:lactate/malate family dehydrogenase n=1 Tax=Haloimpatiens sp. FM7315 TaxID=3298609 RepID=UPI0035A28F61